MRPLGDCNLAAILKFVKFFNSNHADIQYLQWKFWKLLYGCNFFLYGCSIYFWIGFSISLYFECTKIFQFPDQKNILIVIQTKDSFIWILKSHTISYWNILFNFYLLREVTYYCGDFFCSSPLQRLKQNFQRHEKPLINMIWNIEEMRKLIS